MVLLLILCYVVSNDAVEHLVQAFGYAVQLAASCCDLTGYRAQCSAPCNLAGFLAFCDVVSAKWLYVVQYGSKTLWRLSHAAPYRLACTLRYQH